MNDHAKHINAIRNRQLDHEVFDEMERKSAPFMWMMFIAIAFCAFFLAYGQEHEQMSELLSSCANGDPVVFDNQIMTCRLVPLIGG